MANVFVAKVDAIVEDPEIGFVAIRKNITRVVEGHPLLEKYPNEFEPADVNAHFKVRSAKAEPKVPESDPSKKAEAPDKATAE